jgi:hypothetical protein
MLALFLATKPSEGELPVKTTNHILTTPNLSLLVGLASTVVACSTTSATPQGDAGGDDAGVCQTPASEDLYPQDDFRALEASLHHGGGMPVGDGGDDGGLNQVFADGGNDGAPPPPPPVGDGGGAVRPGSGPQLALSGFPNEFGTGASVFTSLAANTAVLNTTLGKNGRHCLTCHSDDDQWTLNLSRVQNRFNTGAAFMRGSGQQFPGNDAATSNDALEPVFRVVDGTNSPLADVSTPEARRAAYSMLLTRAVIRVGLPVPSDAEFELVSADDPYKFASQSELSLFRRSLLMANLRFNTTVMWDGRETAECATMTDDLRHQAVDATTGHAEGATPPTMTVNDIVQTELGIYFAQQSHAVAGELSDDGANGGPTFLAQVRFYWGVNAFQKTDPQAHPFTTEVFTLYQAWRGLSGTARDAARAQIAEGERVFDSREFTVSGVSGFNDELGLTEVTATCGGCHNTPNVGTSSEGRLMDIGLSDEAYRGTDLPLYTFRAKAGGAIIKTTDPGQALVSKKWAHMNRFKVPNLRGLAGRSRYFHNGSAGSIEAVVDYHDQRFGIGLTQDERSAMIAFLSAL